MTSSKFVINRLDLFHAARRLMTISKSYGAVLLLESIDGKLAMSSFDDGLTAVEILPKKHFDHDEKIVVNLERFYRFLQASTDDEINLSITPSNLILSDRGGRGVISRSMVIRREQLPTDDKKIGEITKSALDDLTRVSNLSDSKDSSRPTLHGVMFTITPGDIRTVATNGIAIGYAWRLDKAITTERKERLLIPATAIQVVQRYDWQDQNIISIYRQGSSICFSNGLSYVFATEFAEKDNYPDKMLMEATLESKSKFNFTVDPLLFKQNLDTAVALADYQSSDERTVTVELINGKVFITSGKDGITAVNDDFRGYHRELEAFSFGKDFSFCLNAQLANQAVTLLAQVDKGLKLQVSMGETNSIIFFTAPGIDAVYSVLQISRTS